MSRNELPDLPKGSLILGAQVADLLFDIGIRRNSGNLAELTIRQWPGRSPSAGRRGASRPRLPALTAVTQRLLSSDLEGADFHYPDGPGTCTRLLFPGLGCGVWSHDLLPRPSLRPFYTGSLQNAGRGA